MLQSLDKAPPDHEGGDTRSHEADRLKPVLDKVCSDVLVIFGMYSPQH